MAGHSHSSDSSDDSDGEEADTRRRVNVSTETVRDAIVELRGQKENEEYAVSIRIEGLKPRARARKESKKASEKHEELLVEYRRIICDMYESQVASSVKFAEHELERQEYIAKNLHDRQLYFEFGDSGAHTLAKALKRNTTIEEMIIPNNDIGFLGMKSLCIFFNKNPSLVVIDIHKNPIGVEGAQYLANVMKKRQTLRRLNLHGCALGAEGAVLIAQSLSTHPSLLTLNLRDNDIGETGAVAVSKDLISCNKVLKHLDLATNKIGANAGALALSEALSKNTSLEKIDISHNQMDMALRRPANRQLQLSFKVDRVIGIWPHFEIIY